jgi:membrane protein
LLFVATTLFKIIRDSINQIWNIRIAYRQGLGDLVRSRVRAVFIILVTGLLFLLALGTDMLQAYATPYLQEISPQLDNYVHSVLNPILSFVVVTIWFFILFRYLPDARTHWGVTLTGAVVTGLLFGIGKYALRWVLSGNLQKVYGASGAMVLILLFVFYSSLILYFGAAFTKIWAEHCRHEIEPLHHASKYHISLEDSPGAVA